MFPPADSDYVFMGCGTRGSDDHKLGVIVTPQELFDMRTFLDNELDEAVDVRNFYLYYSDNEHEVIGFSDIKDIQLYTCDVHDRGNESKLCAHTYDHDGGNTLWRCGSKNNEPNDWSSTTEIVFYAL